MKNAEKIANITAGLARVTDAINASELAENAAISLACAPKSLTKLATATVPKELSIALNNEKKFLESFSTKAVNLSPCYAVTHSLHSVNSAKIYI